MKQLTVAVVFVLVCCALAMRYNASKAEAWVRGMGCSNATITNCPGNRLCTDAEFYARALAAGGAIDLNPNDLSQAPYVNYTGYNLCSGAGLYDILPELGFEKHEGGPTAAVASAGSIVFTQMWYPGMPYFAFGADRCDSHTPIVAGGPHCNMNCSFFVPRVTFTPPQ
jgi:hypothetical protein